MNKSYVRANEVLRQLYDNLLNLVERKGLSDLKHGGPSDFDWAASVVVANRFGKGLWSGDSGRASYLHSKAISDSVRDEQRLDHYAPEQCKLSPQQSVVLEAARLNLHQWFRDGNWASPSTSLKVPPGESFVPYRGKISVFQKLKHHDWTITEDAVNDWTNLVMKTRWLRRVARDRVEKSTGKRFNVVLSDIVYDLLSRSKWERHKSFVVPTFTDFEIWKEVILRIVVIVPGSRFSSVNKDTENRRPINVEPLCNCVLQLMDGSEMKDCLARNAQNDLFTGQLDHKLLSRNMAVATVDFSGASQTIHLGWVQRQFPRDLVRKLVAHRSPMINYGYDVNTYSNGKPSSETFMIFAQRLLDERRKEREFHRLYDGILPPVELLADILKADNEANSWFEQCKFASMGNGSTFEVLTALLLSIARALDPRARVYGDDVIISRDRAEEFMQVCTAIGFKVNLTKSFWTGYFRESCGSFWYNQQAIKSFELDQIVSDRSYVIAMNKVSILVKHYREHPKSADHLQQVVQMLEEALVELHKSLPRHLVDYQGPYADEMVVWDPITTRYVTYVQDRYIMAEELRARNLEKYLPEAVVETVSCRLKQLGYPSQVGNWHLFYGLAERKEFVTRTPTQTRDTARIASYLLAGRVSDDLRRVQEEDKRFSRIRYIGLGNGQVFELDELINGCFEPL